MILSGHTRKCNGIFNTTGKTKSLLIMRDKKQGTLHCNVAQCSLCEGTCSIYIVLYFNENSQICFVKLDVVNLPTLKATFLTLIVRLDFTYHSELNKERMLNKQKWVDLTEYRTSRMWPPSTPITTSSTMHDHEIPKHGHVFGTNIVVIQIKLPMYTIIMLTER